MNAPAQLVEQLLEQVRRLRRAVRTNALGWLAVFVLVAGGLYWQDERDAERQRQICGIITLLDNGYTKTPPSTATGQGLASAVHRYRAQLGC